MTGDASSPTSSCPVVTRRRFLATLGAGAAAAVTGTYGVGMWGRDLRYAASIPPPSLAGPGPERTLVVIELGGGNDALNTVVPHADGRYHDLRGSLAIENPIDLDGVVGLHPALEFVAAKYGAGEVAIVEGIGYPEPDLSHFASMSTWWTAADAEVGATGWLGRYLDATVGADDPLAGVTIGPGPSPAMRGDHAFVVTVQDVGGLVPAAPAWIDTRNELMAMWRGFAPAAAGDTSMLGTVRNAIAATVDAAAALTGPLERIQARSSELRDALAIAAALIGSDRPPRVIFVHGWGDFDTHRNQLAVHGSMMAQLDDALAGFASELEGTDRAERTLVMTTSEFGRRVASNGSGTDHGTAAAQLVIGPGVKGGRFGAAPPLDRLDERGNLKHSVDLRSYYATVLDRWLGVPVEAVLGSDFEHLDFV